MNELGENWQRLVAAERETDAPPSEAFERGLSRLRATLATPLPPPAPEGGIAGGGSASGSLAMKIVLAVGLIGGAGVLGWRVVASEESPVPAASVDVDEAPARSPEHPPVVSEPPPPEARLAPEEAIAPEALEEDAAPEEAPEEAPAVRRPRPRGPAPLPTDPFEAELELMRRASRGLAEGRPREALRWAREHELQFPDGMLNEERRATQAIAACTLKQNRAERLALRFLADFGRSTHADRVRSACGILDRQE